MGTLVWKADEATCNGETGYSNQFVELFKGDIDIHLKQKSSVKEKFSNALVTVYAEKNNLKELPITFGYSIRYETQIQFPKMNMDRLPFYEAKVLFSERRGRM